MCVLSNGERVLVTSRIVRWQTAIWCEPAFFVRWALGLARYAKNVGCQIALIFCILFHLRKKYGAAGKI